MVKLNVILIGCCLVLGTAISDNVLLSSARSGACFTCVSKDKGGGSPLGLKFQGNRPPVFMEGHSHNSW